MYRLRPRWPARLQRSCICARQLGTVCSRVRIWLARVLHPFSKTPTRGSGLNLLKRRLKHNDYRFACSERAYSSFYRVRFTRSRRVQCSFLQHTRACFMPGTDHSCNDFSARLGLQKAAASSTVDGFLIQPISDPLAVRVFRLVDIHGLRHAHASRHSRLMGAQR